MAKHVLHLPSEIKVLGGYDTAFGYVLALCRLATALILGAVWTGLDSKRWDYRSLRPLGMQTPHTLLYNFMGFSRTCQVFTGSVECVGALLLLYWRTTTVGACLLLAAMANVVVLDLSYGTFVKMIAVHLLLASAFLMIPDVRRLANVLLLRRPVWDAAGDGPKWTGLRRRRLLAPAKAALLLYHPLTPPEQGRQGIPHLFLILDDDHADRGHDSRPKCNAKRPPRVPA